MQTAPIAHPPEHTDAARRAVRLTYWVIAYLFSTIAFMALAKGSSQAMKTIWVDDALNLIPAIAFLAGNAVAKRRATIEHPYGLHRAPLIGYLAGALALISFGVMLSVEAVLALAGDERPSIKTSQLWPMLAALAYSTIPQIVLARKKEKLAKAIHDRALYTDAAMSKADWLSGTAAALGVIGMSIGWWWADAVAALIVSLDILHDGAKHMRGAMSRLCGARPETTDDEHEDPLVQRVHTALARLPWVKSVRLRLREEGHVVFGEAFIVPSEDDGAVAKVQEAVEVARQADWRMHDLTVTFIAK
jgi:cation diffusion facilitator family transporter